MSKKVIKYGPNERMIIKDSSKQTDIYLSRKNEEKHDHIWFDKEKGKPGADLRRSFHLESNENTGCFLTTACVEYAGLSNECNELETVRHFRDTYIQNLVDGDSILTDYYATAPLIVQRIKSLPNQEKVFGNLFLKLKIVVDLINSQHFLEAWNICEKEFKHLKSEYLHDKT